MVPALVVWTLGEVAVDKRNGLRELSLCPPQQRVEFGELQAREVGRRGTSLACGVCFLARDGLLDPGEELLGGGDAVALQVEPE